MIAELYRLACDEATGRLECARGEIYLRRGYVRAIVVRQGQPDPARLGDLLRERLGPGAGLTLLRTARAAQGSLGRALLDAGLVDRSDLDQALRNQTERRLRFLAEGPITAHFEAGVQPKPDLVSLPFDPLPWLRSFVEGSTVDHAALPDVPMRAVPEPPARMLRRGEAGLARALAQGAIPRELGEAARPLCELLSALAALQVIDTSGGRELRRKLRELHPDAHPHASAAERARLTARFRHLVAAYRRDR